MYILNTMYIKIRLINIISIDNIYIISLETAHSLLLASQLEIIRPYCLSGNNISNRNLILFYKNNDS